MMMVVVAPRDRRLDWEPMNTDQRPTNDQIKTLGFSLGLDYRESAMVITAKNATK